MSKKNLVGIAGCVIGVIGFVIILNETSWLFGLGLLMYTLGDNLEDWV